MTDPLWAIERMTVDEHLQGRIRAAYAKEVAYPESPVPDIGLDPATWAWANRYAMCVAPGWAQDYAYAVETGVEQPGLDPAVIADDRISSQIVAIATASTRQAS